MVPTDYLQPPSDGARGHGHVRAAFPRSVQLQLRPAGAAEHRSGRRGYELAFRARRQAGRDDAFGIELFDVVEWRVADDRLFPQYDRVAYRIDWQSDADGDSTGAQKSTAARRPAVSDR